jgi:1,2-diacylglycerol 3-alpha-glucosyltransferase
MHILMISECYFPRVNGVSTSIMINRRNLQEMGHKVTLVVPEYESVTDNEDGIIRIPGRYIAGFPEDPLMSASAVRAKVNLFREMKIDIIHIQTPIVGHRAGVWLSKTLGIPRMESYHTYLVEYVSLYVKWLPAFMGRYIAKTISRNECNNVTAIAVPSVAMLKVLRGYGVTVKAEIIPTGIDLSQFNGGNGMEFRKRYNISADRPMLVTMGRVALEKNIEFLIHTVEEIRKTIPNVLFVIVGDGPARKCLTKLVVQRRLVDNVLFSGFLDRQTTLKDAYKAADAFVFASRTETQGLVVLEAMAMGLPILTTGKMGVADCVEDCAGAIVVEEDIPQFANQCIRVLQDSALKEKMRQESAKHAAAWSEEIFAKKLEQLYLYVLEERRLAVEARANAKVQGSKASGQQQQSWNSDDSNTIPMLSPIRTNASASTFVPFIDPPMNAVSPT